MNDGLAIWEFSHVMQSGDIIYAKRGLSNIIARGIVKSEYIYDQSQEDFCHTRKVEWTHIGEWTLENIVQKTLTDITKYPDYVKKIETMITEGKNDNKQSTQYDEKYSYYINLLLKNKNLILNGAPGTGKTYLAKQIAAQIIFDGNVPEDFEENEMFINQYGFVQFHPSYDYTDFVEGLRPTPPNKNGNIGFERKDGVFKAFCRNAISTSSSQIVSTFQSVYDSIVKDIEVGAITSYQNRQGQNCPLRVNDKGRIEYRASENSPRTEKEENIKLFYDYFIKNNIYDISSYERDDYWNLIAELSNGSTNKVDYIEYGWILQELLNRTHKVFKESITEIKPYIFIIDEVNRGEISKIFGELFFAIDPGYRGKKGKVQTQYQNLITDESDPFKDGFYIPENVYIIGTMNDIDRSVECMDFAMRRRFTFKEITAEESAKNMGVDPDRMKCLNNAISEIEGFNSSFHIGAAYFRGVTDYEELWELKLQGLLKEYLRGMPDAEENLNTLKKAYFKTEE
jgi:5-methylcytosine-specific restriction endonuclease McrBC GTP-binding regulatory subunit McrB